MYSHPLFVVIRHNGTTVTALSRIMSARCLLHRKRQVIKLIANMTDQEV